MPRNVNKLKGKVTKQITPDTLHHMYGCQQEICLFIVRNNTNVTATKTWFCYITVLCNLLYTS